MKVETNQLKYIGWELNLTRLKGVGIMKTINFVLILLFTLLFTNCSNLMFESKFIDIESTSSLNHSMSIEEVIQRLGQPNEVNISIDDMDNELIIYKYNLREKVYRFTKVPYSNNVLMRFKEFPKEENYYGYSDVIVLTLKFIDGNLISSEVQ